jgi:hypothetical protein
MSYSKVEWTEATPVTAARLEQMDTGIADALRRDGGTLTGRVIAADGNGGEVVVRIPNGKLPAEAPSTYPLWLSSASVTTSNGWPKNGTLLTVRNADAGYAMQLMGDTAGGQPILLVRHANGNNAWHGFQTMIDTRGGVFTGLIDAPDVRSGASGFRIVREGGVFLAQVATNGGSTVITHRDAALNVLARMDLQGAGIARFVGTGVRVDNDLQVIGSATVGGANVARIATGTYTGNGGGTTPRTIPLPFDPAFVGISWAAPGNIPRSAQSGFSPSRPGLNYGSTEMIVTNVNTQRPNPTAGGFIVAGEQSNNLNVNGIVYSYVAQT